MPQRSVSTFTRRPRFPCARVDGIPGSSWIPLSGELDITSVPGLDALLRQTQLRARLVMLDLRDLMFIDSEGAHVIVDAAIRALQQGDRLVVVRGEPQIEMVFQMLGGTRWLDTIDLAATEPCADALERLAREPLAIVATPTRGTAGYRRKPTHSAHQLGSR